VLDDLDAWPPELGSGRRVDIILWRLRGEHGGPSDRIRVLVGLPRRSAGEREALARRARSDGPDRALALYALARAGGREAESILVEALESEDDRVRAAAREGLATIRARPPATAEAARPPGRQG
jgi:hypothetical protein